jgi:hypothetical protein
MVYCPWPGARVSLPERGDVKRDQYAAAIDFACLLWGAGLIFDK